MSVFTWPASADLLTYFGVSIMARGRNAGNSSPEQTPPADQQTNENPGLTNPNDPTVTAPDTGGQVGSAPAQAPDTDSEGNPPGRYEPRQATGAEPPLSGEQTQPADQSGGSGLPNRDIYQSTRP